MIILDHNISNDHLEPLRHRRIHFQKIGLDIGRPEWDDQQEILRHLHRVKQPTFFTRDIGFGRARYCHRNYCLVIVATPEVETAQTIRRFLRHPSFRSKKQRCGKVVRLLPRRITWWQVGSPRQQDMIW